MSEGEKLSRSERDSMRIRLISQFVCPSSFILDVDSMIISNVILMSLTFNHSYLLATHLSLQTQQTQRLLDRYRIPRLRHHKIHRLPPWRLATYYEYGGERLYGRFRELSPC